MAGRPAAGGGRWVSVAPGRLETWSRGFAERHGGAENVLSGDVVRLQGRDGAVAELHVPFPPLGGARADADAVAAAEGDDLLHDLVEHARAERVVGVLLVRLGGHAAGVFEGERLIASKVGSRLVHGRSAAGGWSQHRFARRREKQAAEASQAAAEVAVRVLVPKVDSLEAVVLGGDRRAVDALRTDRRLAPIFALETGPFLDVPDPRLAVLQDTPRTFRAVRIRLLDPPTT
ncbi:acVLRF1 family peptidyl-tRNA hydrolase [Sphaerisporangium perillae]|uniref:acVLRF1 family peptidyl-tRNA hydrolase n=1 Tax=Sphaerisporangium perillae TaxID=2935860 RepID=UPI0024350AB7|nr:acVLRF1 family peptidyl-tRNA hydrolase [Sphaerisporangium perillae]